MFAPGQNRSVKWHKTRPARWPSFARYRKNVYARIGGGRTRRRSRGETENCATDGRRAATFKCASVDRQASWFKATTPADQGSSPRPPSVAQLRHCFCQPDWRGPASNPTGHSPGYSHLAQSLLQAMQDLSVLADEDGRRVMGACPPERTTLLELIQVFVSYVRSHELPDNAALAVTRALQEAFPCKARQGFSGPGGAATFD